MHACIRAKGNERQRERGIKADQEEEVEKEKGQEEPGKAKLKKGRKAGEKV